MITLEQMYKRVERHASSLLPQILATIKDLAESGTPLEQVNALHNDYAGRFMNYVLSDFKDLSWEDQLTFYQQCCIDFKIEFFRHLDEEQKTALRILQ